jgi:hypothetical protein
VRAPRASASSSRAEAETVDVGVIGGIEPTATSAGSGVKHVCPEAA